jgi:hypothetical protein
LSIAQKRAVLKKKIQEGRKMVSVNIHLDNFDEFKFYMDEFADEFILDIVTPEGVVGFMSSNLRDLEEFAKKMLTEVKYRQLLPKREEKGV